MYTPTEVIENPARRPIIIDGDWTVAQLRTIVDCDDALAVLETQANAIQVQLFGVDGAPRRPIGWHGKAERALALKRVGIRQVKLLRDRLVSESESGRFQAAVRALDPVMYERALVIA